MTLSTIAMIVVLVVAGHSAMANECDGLKTAMQIMDGLGKADPIERAQAEACGLVSPDRTTRGLVIQKRLSGGDVFSMSVGSFPGDIEAENFLQYLPAFSKQKVQWSPDRRQFKEYTMQGVLLGDTMTVSFESVRILKKDANRTRDYFSTTCEASLTLNEKRDALSGPLRCAGVPHRFRAWIGF